MDASRRVYYSTQLTRASLRSGETCRAGGRTEHGDALAPTQKRYGSTVQAAFKGTLTHGRLSAVGWGGSCGSSLGLFSLRLTARRQ
eukprot:2021539-Rhodomonas_salina.2